MAFGRDSLPPLLENINQIKRDRARAARLEARRTREEGEDRENRGHHNGGPIRRDFPHLFRAVPYARPRRMVFDEPQQGGQKPTLTPVA